MMYTRPLVFVLWFWFLVALAPSTNAEETCEPLGFFSCRVTPYDGLTDKTLRFDSAEYGSGAIYLAPDGRAFLWVVGDVKVKSGFWMVGTFPEKGQSATSSEQTARYFDVFMLKFQKSRRKINLFPGLDGSESFRVDDLAKELGAVEKVDGDVLRLQNRTGPCRACREGMTISELVASMSP
jgi:hypothetical protein